MHFKSLFIAFLLLPYFLLSLPGFHEPWGKDCDLKPLQDPLPDEKLSLAVRFAHKIILFHQNVISPVDGPRSHFRPTSSRYMYHAMRRYGFFKGYLKGCDRLMRENSEDWVYRLIEIDGKIYKWDPP
jgi:uncharacterized protein